MYKKFIERVLIDLVRLTKYNLYSKISLTPKIPLYQKRIFLSYCTISAQHITKFVHLDRKVKTKENEEEIE